MKRTLDQFLNPESDFLNSPLPMASQTSPESSPLRIAQEETPWVDLMTFEHFATLPEEIPQEEEIVASSSLDRALLQAANSISLKVLPADTGGDKQKLFQKAFLDIVKPIIMEETGKLKGQINQLQSLFIGHLEETLESVRAFN